MKKILLLLIVFIVAWLWANHQTGVRINHRRAYKSAAIELDALRAIRAGDNQKAITILENSLKSYAIDLKIFDSFLVKNRHRVAADKFMVQYEEYIAQQAAAPDASRQ